MRARGLGDALWDAVPAPGGETPPAMTTAGVARKALRARSYPHFSRALAATSVVSR